MEREPSKFVNDGHGNLTFRIIGCCMAVHNDLGPGHREIVYQRALAHRFHLEKIAFEEWVPLQVIDEFGKTLIIYKPDFRVEHCVWVEIKAYRHQLTGDDQAQVIDYFTADAKQTCDVALLVNFGRVRLEWARLFPPRNVGQIPRKKWGQRIENK
jgi:GxxExxY protein